MGCAPGPETLVHSFQPTLSNHDVSLKRSTYLLFLVIVSVGEFMQGLGVRGVFTWRNVMDHTVCERIGRVKYMNSSNPHSPYCTDSSVC